MLLADIVNDERIELREYINVVEKQTIDKINALLHHERQHIIINDDDSFVDQFNFSRSIIENNCPLIQP